MSTEDSGCKAERDPRGRVVLVLVAVEMVTGDRAEARLSEGNSELKPALAASLIESDDTAGLEARLVCASPGVEPVANASEPNQRASCVLRVGGRGSVVESGDNRKEIVCGGSLLPRMFSKNRGLIPEEAEGGGDRDPR